MASNRLREPTPVRWGLRLLAVVYVFFLVIWPVSLVVKYTFADGHDTFCLCGCITSGPDDPICPWCEGWCPMCGATLPVRSLECDCGAKSPAPR